MDKIILELRQSKLSIFFGYVLLLFGIASLIFPIWGYITMSSIKLEEVRQNMFSMTFFISASFYLSMVTLLLRWSILVITANKVLKLKPNKLIITSKWKKYSKILNLDDMISWVKIDDGGAGSGDNIFIKTTNQKLRLSSYEFMGLGILEDYLRENYKDYEI